ncbi:hypothetical protein F0562_027816 [Nyssa sinensis]|uniref:Uncharacterized protein n=1 Tax=Nyssa sinensis TaxID=561372 RepID=A0A5J5BAY0_9ASTE|nr:hypothetical protein F0562_027816 [Nyssa sinensis]
MVDHVAINVCPILVDVDLSMNREFGALLIYGVQVRLVDPAVLWRWCFGILDVGLMDVQIGFWRRTVKDGNSVQVRPEQEKDGSLGCVATGKELMMMPVLIGYTGLRLTS